MFSELTYNDPFVFKTLGSFSCLYKNVNPVSVRELVTVSNRSVFGDNVIMVSGNNTILCSPNTCFALFIAPVYSYSFGF